ncbi:hypothetical protein UFOVP413_14 [uncultured Caudovirales phage]|uniref:Uncharacterized protein n=1 Tax=uncultured Caudovirales phage TaxID=2100421 RepID=A0A6J5MBF1_9CAUD|nr:hypothetical protein UFOVP413_14 [uncultured Caudovirales phage]
MVFANSSVGQPAQFTRFLPRTYSVNVGTLSAVGAATVAEQNVTIAGLTTKDVVLRVEKPTHQAGLSCSGGRVASADTLAIQFSNPTASGITPTASEVYRVVVVQVVE